MAKKSMIAKERKRARLEAKYRKRRDAIRQRMADQSLSGEDRFQAMLELQKLPRNSSLVRRRNRCALTGRPRGVYRKFGVCRNKLREIFMNGEAPGVKKSSW
ncbi:MAG: 30S ribosomal protein S14 [Gammaproteobacteria bacterium]|nr:30S ribosomal protein S14 [Gammaproteobacteria bacterium]